jgi:SAM-dependent methyltransferase
MSEMQLAYFKAHCDLQKDSKILDIGSGMGRSAVALTEYLNEAGKYEGFDVVKRGVNWCKKNISSRFPNFNFTYIPLNNDLYRSDGDAPEEFRFPYQDDYFDLIIVNSVFTHMVESEVVNYFKEMSRVLKTGGHVYATFFIYKKGQTTFPKGFGFPHDYGNYRLMDDEVKSANVAFMESFLEQELAQKNNFKIKHFFKGSWRGLDREQCKEFQDLLILKKS